MAAPKPAAPAPPDRSAAPAVPGVAAGRADAPAVPAAPPDSSWRACLRRELSRGWPRWVSFACIWVWTCIVGKSALGVGAAAQLSGMFAVPTAVTLFATVAMLVVILCLSDALATVVGSRGAMTLGGLLLVGGSVGIAAATVGGWGLAWFVAGSCMGGASIGLLKIAWGEMFSHMSLRAGLIDMGASLVVSTVAFCGLLFAPSAVQAAVLVAVALPCSWLVRLGTRRLEDEPAPPPPPGAAKAVNFGWTLLILPFLVGLAYGLINGVLVVRPAGAALLSPLGTTLAELLAGAVLLAASRMLSERFGASQIYAVGLVFTVAGLALASVEAVPTWVAASVDELGFAVFYFFMVVYWGDLARRVGRSVVRTYALGYTVFQASQIPGMAAGYGLVQTSGETGVALLCTAVVLVFFVVTLLVFNDPRSALRQWLTAGEPAEVTDEIPEACAAIAARFSLSPREREVLSLLARGRTAAYIGRSLGIAPDTAKTHMRSIYRKMDIHSQQDLIELIERQVRGEAG